MLLYSTKTTPQHASKNIIKLYIHLIQCSGMSGVKYANSI